MRVWSLSTIFLQLLIQKKDNRCNINAENTRCLEMRRTRVRGFSNSKRERATFFSLAEEWVLRAASTKEPEEGEFVVDSGVSMHVVSKRDLNSAELETIRTSRSPTSVMMANGEVQTREEATENVKELDLFVTVMLLEETSAVLSHGKLCQVFLPLDQRSKTTSHQKWQEIWLQYIKLWTHS